MGRYNNTVITNTGLSLLAQAELEEGAIIFTKIKTGTGTYEESEDLKEITDLKEIKNEYSISSANKEDSGTIKLRCELTNSEVKIGYNINEIGIYGKIKNEEALIGIATAVNPDYFPSHDIAPSSILLEIYMTVTNCDNVLFQYTVPEGVYELATNAQERYTAIENRVSELEDNKAEADGTNATGTWGISITGNAKTATTATSAGTCTGNSATATKATSADELNTNAGSATNPTYFADGIPKACTYSLNKTVPSDAVFTDTKYVVSTSMTDLGFTNNSTYTILELFTKLIEKGYSGKTQIKFTYSNAKTAKVSDGTTTINMNGATCYLSIYAGGSWRRDYAIVTIDTKVYLLYVGYDGSTTPSSQRIIDVSSTVATSCTGNAATASAIKNPYTFDTRPTSANIDFSNSAYWNKMTYIQATSKMTTGRPNVNGAIINIGWDNPKAPFDTEGAQLFIPTNGDGYGAMQFRKCIAIESDDSFKWQDWFTLLDSENYSDYAIPLTGTTALAGNIIPKSTSYQLGSDTYPFSQGYFTTAYVKSGLYSLYHYIRDSVGNIQGRLEGNSTTATMYSSAGDSTSDTIGADLFGTTNLRLRAGSRVYLSANTSISASRGISIASDAKIKEFTDDIEQDKKALIKLFDIIQIKTYRYRYSDKNKLTLGFSAQDVEKACNEMGVDPEKYGILNIMYNHYMYRGDDDEDIKFYTKFYEISYNDLYNLALLKIQSMEKEHKEILEEHNNRIKALEEKLL